jgi:hypothetical protein
VWLAARGGGGVVVAALVRISEDLLGGTDVLLPWRAAAATGLVWMRSGSVDVMASACFDSRGLLRWRAGSSSPLLLDGLDRIKEAVLGFLSHQDEDLPDSCLH